MSLISVDAPFPVFYDINGESLESGYLYIGTTAFNPMITSNQLLVYADSALTIPVAQPVRTSGGYPVNSGSPTRLYVGAADYSIVVLSKNGALIHSSLSNKAKLGLIDLSTDVTGTLLSTLVKHAITPAELAALVTPVDYSYEELHIYRYQTNTIPGTTNMSTGLAAAIAVAQAAGNNPSVLADPGLYAFGSQIVITGANKGIQIVATEPASRQNGSVRPSVMFRWIGGADEMFLLDTAFVGFQYVAFENWGTGTSCFQTTVNGGRIDLIECSFIYSGVGSSARWSVSIIDALANGTVNYSTFDSIEMASPAPVFLTYDGLNPPSGNTTIEFKNIIADCDGADFTFIKVKDGGFDRIVIHDSTFNTQTNHTFCILDASLIGIAANIIQVFEMRNVEYDNPATPAAGRMVKLKNVRAAKIENLQVTGGGNITALGSLTNSTLHTGTIYASAINGPLWECLDAVSQVWPAPCPLVVDNTKGITLETTGICGQVDLTYGATINLLLHLGHPGAPTVFYIEATNGAAFAIELPDHLAAPPNATFRTRGQIFAVRIKNSRAAGNALGAITFGAAFSIKGTVIGPDAGKELTVWFVWDGTTAAEIGRGDMESGSGTFTLTGCTTSPTQTFHYARSVDLVCICVDNSLTATSNSANKTLTHANTLPVSCWPARAQTQIARVFDNGGVTPDPGFARVETNGVITLGLDYEAGNGGFTAAGVAGIAGSFTITILRN